MKKVFKKSSCLLALAFIFAMFAFGISFALPSGTNVASADTSIKDTNIVYNSVDKEIVVSPEKVLDITETITVSFYKSGINVGLSRNISKINKITVFYKGKKYVKRTVNKFKLLSVTLDGEDEFNFVETKGDYFYILTGADGDYKSEGKHVYVIRYLLDMGEDMVKDFDSFTFDIMDYGFRSQVNHFSARITLPQEFLAEGQALTDVLSFRTNEMQGLGLEAVDCTVEGNTISCNFTGLAKKEGLTMQLLLPQGYFHTYYYPNSMFWVVLSFLIVFVLGVIAIFLFVRLRKRKKMVIVPQFYPPKTMNALEVASAYRGYIKGKDFAALIISWAAKGYVEIEFRKKRKLVLKKLKGVPSKADERKFFNELFDGDELVKVDRRLRSKRSLSKAVEKLYEPSKKKSHMNWPFQVAIGVLTFLPLLFYIGWGVTVFGSNIATCFFFMIFITIGFCVFFYVPIPLWFKAIWCGGFGGMPFAMMVLTFLPTDYDTIGLIYMIIAFMLAGNFANCFLSYRNFTDKELSVRADILGFKQFLVTAELDKLEMLLEEDPNYFYDILPYCYIFGITKKMEEKFKELHFEYPQWIEEMGVAGACTCIGHSISHSVGGSFSSGGSGGGGGGGGGSSGGGGGGGGCGGR